MARKKHKNIVDLAKGLEEDQAFTRDLASHLGKRRLVHNLTAMRAAKGLTQQEVAAKMGCTQGRISKMETSEDLELTFASIVQYAQALGLRLEITLTSKDASAVDRVKHHAFRIKRETDFLARLALADEKIADGVARFFDEAAFNLLHMLLDSAKKLPEPSEEPMPTVEVDTCGVDDLYETKEARGRSSKRSARVE